MGAGFFNIADDLFTANRKRVWAVCREILDRGLDVRFTTPNGIALWALDEELLELMKAAGVYHLTLAIESGDQQVLNDIIERCRELNLRLIHSEEQTKLDFTMMLTVQTMNYMHSGRHRVWL